MRIYRTHDVALAAFLLLREYTLLSITEPQESGWKQFEFTSDPALDGHVQDYFNGAPVPARHYASTLSQLKKAMHQSQSKQKGSYNNVQPLVHRS